MKRTSFSSAIWFGSPPSPQLEASNDPELEPLLRDLSFDDLPEAARMDLLAGRPTELNIDAAISEAAPSGDPSEAPCLIVPLIIQDDVRGVLCIWSARRLSRETHQSLHVLAAQVALALERTTVSEDLHRREGEERYASPSVAQVLGRSVVDLIGTEALQLIHPESVVAASHLVTTVRESTGTTRAEISMQHADGSWRDFEVVAANLLAQPAIRGIVLNCHDVTDRKALEHQLTELAFDDPLTALANRALLADRLAHALARADRQKTPVAILLLDLDDFKIVNDSSVIRPATRCSERPPHAFGPACAWKTPLRGSG